MNSNDRLLIRACAVQMLVSGVGRGIPKRVFVVVLGEFWRRSLMQRHRDEGGRCPLPAQQVALASTKYDKLGLLNIDGARYRI